jgi:hypothetical protein
MSTNEDSFTVHWFELKIKDPPRSWNKSQWKSVCHWLRASRAIMEKTYMSDIHRTVCDIMLNGYFKST